MTTRAATKKTAKKNWTPRPRRTPEEARTFPMGESGEHAVILAMAAHARGCECEAYKDWFDMSRWNDQGFAVRKGEHGVCLITYKTITDEETGEVVKKFPRKTYVYCRHQVREFKKK